MAVFKTLRDYLRAIAPAWLLRPKGAAWLRAMGDQKDATVDRAKSAVKQRFFELADADALAFGGQERQIVRGPLETNAVYGERLIGAWDTWQWGGTAKAVLEAMSFAGLPPAVIAAHHRIQYWLEESVFQVGSGAVTVSVASGRTLPVVGHIVLLRRGTTTHSFRLFVDGTEVDNDTYTPGAGYDLGDLDVRLAGVVVLFSAGDPAVDDAWVFWAGPGREGLAIAGPLQGIAVGSWWNANDPGNTFWSKFEVLFPGYTAGFDAAQLALARTLIRRWKSAQSTCSKITVMKYGRTVGFPQRKLGDGGKVGGYHDAVGAWHLNEIVRYAP